MTHRLWLVVLLLGVPALGFAVSAGVQAHFNSELRSALLTNFPDADPQKVAEMTVDQLCEASPAEFRSLCVTNRILNLMRQAALAAGLVGLFLLLVIRLAGALACRSRILLVAFFKPGLYLTAIVLIMLIVVHAAIAMAAIYYGESALIGRIHVGIIATIGLGALLGVVAMGRSTFSLVRKAQTVVIGKPLSRQQAPELWRQIDEAAQQLGSLRPEHLVVGLDPNFFVTEADVICLGGKLSGRTLYCSLPLSRILDLREFNAIVGHELGHFKGEDTRFSERFYPIYRGTASSISALEAAGGGGSAVIGLLPAIVVLTYFLESFSIAESRLSRYRELAADQAGAGVTSPPVMAAALVKVHAFSGVWEGLQEAAAKALREGRVFVNASALYADVVSRSASSEALKGVGEAHVSHPTDSHPPLSDRLRSLHLTLAEVTTAALAVSPSDPSAGLVPDLERQEEEISQAYQVLLASQLGISLDEPGTTQEASCDVAVGTEDWACPQCGVENPGTRHSCKDCGFSLV